MPKTLPWLAVALSLALAWPAHALGPGDVDGGSRIDPNPTSKATTVSTVADPPDQGVAQLPPPVIVSAPPKSSSREARLARTQARDGATRGTFDGARYGPVGDAESLSRIAARLRPPGVSTEQSMLALYRGNSRAFAGGRLEGLKRGSVLRVPSLDEMTSVAPHAAAEAIAQLRRGAAPVGATPSVAAAAPAVAEKAAASAAAESPPAPVTESAPVETAEPANAEPASPGVAAPEPEDDSPPTGASPLAADSSTPTGAVPARPTAPAVAPPVATSAAPPASPSTQTAPAGWLVRAKAVVQKITQRVREAMPRGGHFPRLNDFILPLLGLLLVALIMLRGRRSLPTDASRIPATAVATPERASRAAVRHSGRRLRRSGSRGARR